KVLAEILGLSFYDQLEQRAKDNAKERKIEVNRLEVNVNEIDIELKAKNDLEEAYKQLDVSLKSIEQDLNIAELELNSLRLSKKAYGLLQERQKDISKHLEQSIRQIEVMNKRVKEHKLRIERYQKSMKTYPDDISQIKVRLVELDGLAILLSEKRKIHQELVSTIHHLKTVNLRLKEEMNDLKLKMELLKQGKAECPLCGTELGMEGQNRIITNYQNQGTEKAGSYRTNDVLIKNNEVEASILINEINSLENRISTDRVRDERRKAELDKEYSEAAENIPQEQSSLDSVEEEVIKIKLSIEEARKNMHQISMEMENSTKEDAKLRQAELKYNNLQNAKQDSRDRLVSVREKIIRCVELEKLQLHKREELSKLLEEKSIYDELTVAFGKKGIQALIIESAIPEIEIEADRLLAKMTDNRMHLKIESQRAKISKKDELEETLDIKVSDELGTRNYEMFSGGEAFRINFAIRIALSRLLARRHGAPLPTLIIDEGFGTQDNAGKEKIIEAINTIQDDFEKIIVVTHIEELKEAFPVRIQVSKTVSGSIVEIN
ncbi:MAG: hypothetical protein NTV30_08445, partial [Chloroflexi bacterium]|nr:hypothetical protein [Chloroflexota bacterium]